MLLDAAQGCSVLLGAARCCPVLPGAARCCPVLLGAALPCLMAVKNVARVIEIARAQSSHGIVLFQSFMEHCVGAHEAQEMLAEMLGSCDHPELSSTGQG